MAAPVVPPATLAAAVVVPVVRVIKSSRRRPAQGFRLHEEHEGPRVRFRSKEAEVEVNLRFQDGRPVGAVEVDD
jgi:hypothetical protein